MDIKSANYLVSSAKLNQCPTSDRPEYAFIGRSNVGKSSLINMLTGRKALAKVSGSPGKTTLINHFIINADTLSNNKGWYLVDLPGYGYAKRAKNQRKEWQKMISDYLCNRPTLQTVFVLLDSRLSPQEIDIKFINQLGEWGIPFNLIFTKSDKNKQSETAKNVNDFLKELAKYWESIPEYFITSAIKMRGREKVLAFIGNVNEQFSQPDKEEKSPG